MSARVSLPEAMSSMLSELPLVDKRFCMGSRWGSMDVFEAIRTRRSLKPNLLKPDPVDRALLERLFEAANWAPSHGLTEPWRFIVVFEGEARRALIEAVLDTMLSPGEAPKIPDDARRTSPDEKVLRVAGDHRHRRAAVHQPQDRRARGDRLHRDGRSKPSPDGAGLGARRLLDLWEEGHRSLDGGLPRPQPAGSLPRLLLPRLAERSLARGRAKAVAGQGELEGLKRSPSSVAPRRHFRRPPEPA